MLKRVERALEKVLAYGARVSYTCPNECNIMPVNEWASIMQPERCTATIECDGATAEEALARALGVEPRKRARKEAS